MNKYKIVTSYIKSKEPDKIKKGKKSTYKKIPLTQYINTVMTM